MIGWLARQFSHLAKRRKWLRWQQGRQLSGYNKMLLASAKWPKPIDVYLLHFPEGSEIAPHTDKVESGQHHRINIIIKAAKKGGEFICAQTIYQSQRIKYFRPDMAEHSVSKIEQGSRYVFSVGWVNRGEIES